jgi:hypothetical protein
MSNTGNISEMNRKLKENRDNGGSSTSRKKSTRMFASSSKSFKLAKRENSLKLVAIVLTFIIFTALLILGMKVLEAYNSYEINRPDENQERAIQADFELFISYGQQDLSGKYYEGAKIEFENALKLFPNNPTALAGLQEAEEHLND